MSLRHQLETHEHLTINEHAIRQFLLDHPTQVLTCSIYDFAKATHTSPATVVRFCQKMGYSGFKEFKLAWAQATSDNNPSTLLPFFPCDTPLETAQKIAQLSIDIIQKTQLNLSEQQLSTAISMLTHARHSFGIGVSECFLCLTDFQSKLLKIGHFLNLVPLQAEQFYLAAHSKKDDVALIVSYSGETAEIINDALLFQRNKTPIIALTSSKESTLSQLATLTFILPHSQHTDKKTSHIAKKVAIEYILNILYTGIFQQNYDKNIQFYQDTPKASF